MEEWIEASIYTTSNAIQCVTDMLTAVGVNGFAVEDSEDFEEFLNGTVSNWDFIDDSLMWMKDCETKIKFYLPDNPQGRKMLEDVKKGVEELPSQYPDFDLGSLELRCNDITEEDWSNEWKKYYHPIRVGKNIVVCPIWEDYEKKPRDVILKLNPGMAFGTGQHDTTRLCMQLLEKHIKGDERVLDVGCGSGILAVTAVLLGAQTAKGVDIDELAAKVAVENAQINNVEDKTEFYAGTLNSVEQLKGNYDIICMNIVADVIISLLDEIKSYMKENTHLLISGIIDTREKDVADELKQKGYNIKKRLTSSGWVAYDCILN